MKNKIDLSIVVTAHNEGLLAHKAMLSVFEGIERVENEGYVCEIIVHIDNGDMATKDYFNRYNNDKRVRIYNNSFGDLGSSRNYATSVAKGKYISFLDGDDLVSSNWYVDALKMLIRSDKKMIVHPEAILNFGFDQPVVLTLQKPSLDKGMDILLLLGENRWTSVAMAPKEVFLDTPYFKKTPGYNFEDYVFNIETTERGIKHDIVKGTVLFYRRSGESMLSKANQNHDVIPYAELFDYKNLKNIKESVEPRDFEENKAIRRANLYKRIRSNRIVNALVTPLAIVVRRTTGKKPKIAKIVPDFVLEEWAKMNHIETQLYPYQFLVNSVVSYSAGGLIKVGNAYFSIMKEVHDKPDYVFIAPFITRGGAEKVLVNYVNALSTVYPKRHFAIITTLPSENDWISKLPENTDVIDFGNASVDLSDAEREILFSRIITQLQCSNMHIINSEYGYRWVIKHRELVRNHFNLTVSLFASEFIPESNMKARYSYDDPLLLSIYDVVKKVFTDNRNIIEETVAKNGFDENKFMVHYQPVGKMKYSGAKDFSDGKVHILWAGRIVNLKLPQVVAKIGKIIDRERFVIDIYGDMSDEVDSKIFDGIKAIKYHGAYDGFESLMDKKFDLFLYTSLTDGIPNTILEAASCEIPIIASDDGGVGEFVRSGETGVLITDLLNAESYVEAIEKLSSDEKEMKRLIKNAKKLVEERQSWDSFVKQVSEDFTI